MYTVTVGGYYSKISVVTLLHLSSLHTNPPCSWKCPMPSFLIYPPPRSNSFTFLLLHKSHYY